MKKSPGQITMAELNPHGVVLPMKYHRYLKDLYIAVNEIRFLWGHPMVVTSGIRPRHQQTFIYAKINSERRARGEEEIPVPYNSAHVVGAAVDIYDPNDLLFRYLTETEGLIDKFDIFIEDKKFTPEHVHLQIRRSDKDGGNPSAPVFRPY